MHINTCLTRYWLSNEAGSNLNSLGNHGSPSVVFVYLFFAASNSQVAEIDSVSKRRDAKLKALDTTQTGLTTVLSQISQNLRGRIFTWCRINSQKAA